jgi:hypothetical protein
MLTKRSYDRGSTGHGRYCRLMRFGTDVFAGPISNSFSSRYCRRKQYSHQLIRTGKKKMIQWQPSPNKVHGF